MEGGLDTQGYWGGQVLDTQRSGGGGVGHKDQGWWWWTHKGWGGGCWTSKDQGVGGGGGHKDRGWGVDTQGWGVLDTQGLGVAQRLQGGVGVGGGMVAKLICGLI